MHFTAAQLLTGEILVLWFWVFRAVEFGSVSRVLAFGFNISSDIFLLIKDGVFITFFQRCDVPHLERTIV